MKPLPVAGGGLGQSVDDLQIQHRLGAGSERDALIEFVEVEREGVGQRVGDLAKGAHQRLLEVGAAVLLHRLLGDEHGEQLALADLHGRELPNLPIVAVAVVRRLEHNRQLHPVAHEGDVAVNRLGGHLKLGGQLAGVGMILALEEVVNLEHPLDRRAGVSLGDSFAIGCHERLPS